MDTRMREYDGEAAANEIAKLAMTLALHVAIPEVRNELSGIHVTIKQPDKRIPACASMTVKRTANELTLIGNDSVPPLRHTRSDERAIWYPCDDKATR